MQSLCLFLFPFALHLVYIRLNCADITSQGHGAYSEGGVALYWMIKTDLETARHTGMRFPGSWVCSAILLWEQVDGFQMSMSINPSSRFPHLSLCSLFTLLCLDLVLIVDNRTLKRSHSFKCLEDPEVVWPYWRWQVARTLQRYRVVCCVLRQSVSLFYRSCSETLGESLHLW